MHPCSIYWQHLLNIFIYLHEQLWTLAKYLKKRKFLKTTTLFSMLTTSQNSYIFVIFEFQIIFLFINFSFQSLSYNHKYIDIPIYKTYQQEFLGNILILGNNTWNKIHTSWKSESSKLKLGQNRQNTETMLKTLRFKGYARFEFEYIFLY